MVTLRQFIAANVIRHSWGGNDRKRDAGQTTPAQIQRFDNILYGDDKRYKKWQLLDVYRPKAADDGSAQGESSSLKKLPVIISIHGGGWVYGDKDAYQFYCMNLATRGFAVINYSYRLAPERKFPSSLQDTEKVFQWVCDNAEQYGFDTDNVFAVGDSAGGHLLTMYAAAITNPEFGSTFPFIHKKPLILRGVGLNCGKYTLEASDSQMKLLLSGLMPKGGTEEELQLMNAASHVTKDFPAAFVMTCYGDFLKDQAPVICNALAQAGVKYESHCYATEEEPLWHVFHCDLKLKEATRCNDEECSFFNSLIVKN